MLRQIIEFTQLCSNLYGGINYFNYFKNYTQTTNRTTTTRQYDIFFLTLANMLLSCLLIEKHVSSLFLVLYCVLDVIEDCL